MRFLSNFGCKIMFMCFVNFGHQQDSNSLFKESTGHVTSYCKWPIVKSIRVFFNDDSHHLLRKESPLGNLSKKNVQTVLRCF